MILKVGITGGIGGGKSTVAKVFEVLGIPVYYADDAAKRLMQEDEGLKYQLQQLFGKDSFLDGKLNRPYISQIVFNNAEKLAQLNAIVHPVTIKDSEQWMLQQKTPYAIKEAALIIESGMRDQLDYLIGVTAPAPLRIQRVMERDHLTREAVVARMEKQMDETAKMQQCDAVIINDEKLLVIPQVVKLHELLVGLKHARPILSR